VGARSLAEVGGGACALCTRIAALDRPDAQWRNDNEVSRADAISGVGRLIASLW